MIKFLDRMARNHNYLGMAAISGTFIIAFILGICFLGGAFASDGQISEEYSIPEESNITCEKIQNESPEIHVYKFRVYDVGMTDGIMDNFYLIKKFSFSDVLYLQNSQGIWTPIYNEDGTLMTYQQYLEKVQ